VLGHNTGSVESGKKYRPLFLDHFDKKEAPEIGKVKKNLVSCYIHESSHECSRLRENVQRHRSRNAYGNAQILGAQNTENAKTELPSPSESQRFQSHLQLQLQNQISHPLLEQPHNNISKFQNVFTERDFDFVSSIPYHRLDNRWDRCTRLDVLHERCLRPFTNPREGERDEHMDHMAIWIYVLSLSPPPSFSLFAVILGVTL